jgi:hypothetical protein
MVIEAAAFGRHLLTAIVSSDLLFQPTERGETKLSCGVPAQPHVAASHEQCETQVSRIKRRDGVCGREGGSRLV